MTALRPEASKRIAAASEHELLLLLDLAMETLEGLRELGVETRAEIESLMAIVERQIAEQE